jgi:hypothetical protein
MAKSSIRPVTVDEAIRKGMAGEGAGCIGGRVICPYSRDDKEHFWAWTGAYEACHVRT